MAWPAVRSHLINTQGCLGEVDDFVTSPIENGFAMKKMMNPDADGDIRIHLASIITKRPVVTARQ
jgi:hypothetical protein